MRDALIVVISGLLVAQPTMAQQPPADTEIRRTIAALPAKAHVDVQLTNGTVERGRIVSRAENDFEFKHDNRAGEQTISYGSVRSVAQLDWGHSRRKWIVIGIAAGAVIAVVAIALLLKNHPVLNLGGRL